MITTDNLSEFKKHVALLDSLGITYFVQGSEVIDDDAFDHLVTDLTESEVNEISERTSHDNQ